MPFNPQEAFTVPLKVLAERFGHPELAARLKAALVLQEQEPPEAMAPTQVLREAVSNLIRQGYRERFTLKQLMLEMRLLAGDDATEMSNTETPEWQEPRWVGRTLRAQKLVDPDAKDERRWLWGEQTRLVTPAPDFVAKTLGAFDAQDVAYSLSVWQPLAFCLPRLCSECPYHGFCSMRARKERL